MKRRRVVRWRGLGVSLIAAAGVLATVLAMAVRVPPPRTLEPAKPTTSVAVTERTFDDRRTVQLTVETGVSPTVSAPRAGKLTALDCSPGATISSGSAPVAIDGQRLILLATSTPLWRALSPGDRGDDVTALQTELSRLGYPTAVDGVLGTSTLTALAALRTSLHLRSGPTSQVDPADFVWSPLPEGTIDSCVGVVGTPVAEGGELMTLPVPVVSARLAGLPADGAPGPRVVSSGDVEVATDDQGAVRGPEDLAKISQLPEFAAKAGTEGDFTIPVTWALRAPLRASVVPPTALWDIADGFACIQPPKARPAKVAVVGSDLGQSFVIFEGTAPAAVLLHPPTGGPCR